MDYAVDYITTINTGFNSGGRQFVYDQHRYFSKLYVLLKLFGVIVYTTTLFTCSSPDFYFFMIGMMCLSTANSARYEYRHYQRYGTTFASMDEYQQWKQQQWPKSRLILSMAELGIKAGFFIRTFPPQFEVRSMCDVGQSIFNIHIFAVFTFYILAGISCACFFGAVYCFYDDFQIETRAPQTRFTVIQHQNEECCICLDKDAIQVWLALPCGHTFHNLCISRWVVTQDTCPVCRVRVSVSVSV